MNLSRIVNFGINTTTRILFQPQNYAKVCVNSLNCQRGYCNFEKQTRSVSTIEAKEVSKEDGFIKTILKKIPFLNVDRTRIMAAGYLLYEEVADQVDYIEFFEELDLPDTFYSWFVIAELHVWMLSARAMAEGDDGKLLRNSLIEALWRDVNQRVKRLGASNPAVTRAQVAELAEQLQAALIAYDEGLQSDDAVLASALWRRFYQQSDVDPRFLEILVKYVRKHVRLLDHLPKEHLLSSQKVKWEPLKKHIIC